MQLWYLCVGLVCGLVATVGGLLIEKRGMDWDVEEMALASMIGVVVVFLWPLAIAWLMFLSVVYVFKFVVRKLRVEQS